MISPEHIRRFEEALHTECPYDSLYHLAVSLRDSGVSQFDLYLLFEHFFIQVRDAVLENEQRYDAVADNMDLIWGGPWAKDGALYGVEIDKTALEHYRHQA